MENNNFPFGADLKNLVKQLSKGRELATQLQSNLNQQFPSDESREFLAERIVYSYDNALSILAHTAAPPPEAAAATSDSQPSLAGSPRSDDSDEDFKDQDPRKRKAGSTWSYKVKVAWPERGIEGETNDGGGWRNYGQKDITGAKYPRGYYKCTYRHTQGCLATKRVQRSDHLRNHIQKKAHVQPKCKYHQHRQ